MKKVFILAAAAITFAACTDENYLGENKEFTKTDNPIGFNMLTSATSRAELSGKAAADSLHNVFYVYGIKNESTKLGTITTNDVNNVMNNYKVVYADGTAMSTTSNTEGWEYVAQALTSNEVANYTPNVGGTDEQTIKYWDWGASDYTFTAFSANPKEGETIKVTKIYEDDDALFTAATDPLDKTSAYNYGYKVSLSNLSSLAGIYLSDRVFISKSFNETRTADNTYGGNVTFKFRNFGSKVRAAFYETIPGYTVTINKMYGAETADDSQTNFVASCPNIAEVGSTPVEAVVTYYNETEAEVASKNQPKVKITTGATAANTLKLGTGVFTTAGLAVDNTNPTWDKENGAYTFVLPQETNTTPMKITVDYTLTCAKTGEVIKVKGATAEVPAQYLQWKSNYAYTYMFKISDNTNGYSGTTSDPAGLYPITFDAMTIDNGNGSTDYITTVSEPSITTFGYNSTSNTYIASASAYPAGTDIYATVMAGETPTVQTLTINTTAGEYVAGNVNLLKITKPTTTDASYITEAAVAEYFAENYEEKMGTTPKLTAVVDNSKVAIVDKVPGENGVDISISALHVLNTLEKGWYAVQYIETAAVKKVVAVYDSGSVLTLGTALTDYYTKDGDVYTKCATDATADGTTTYYKQTTAPVAPKAPKAQYKVFEIK